MKPGVLFLPALAIVLAACGSSHATSSSTPVTRSATPASTPASTTDPQPSPTATPARVIVVPKNASPFVKGTKYLQAHNYAQAKEQFTLSIKRGQHVADSYADLGTLALEQLKYADAYRAYRSAVKRNPKNPGYEYYAAYSSLYAGDYSSAVSYASRYIRLASKNPAGYHLRFLAYGKLLDAKEQLKDARTVVALAPKAAFAYVDLGAALANDKQPKAAIQAFSQAIRLQPRQGLYYIDRAQAENMTRQTALVLRDLETARSLATDPKTRRQIDQAIAQVKHPSSTATP